MARPVNDTVQRAKEVLERSGYVVVKAKSHRQAQERQRVAEALRRAAEESQAGTERWAREHLCGELSRLRERLTFVYGVARAKGATVEELTQ